jgi:hypothetical protein
VGKGMDKYPLIGGSIVAVLLLVSASLTNVVGYQSVQSYVPSGSPLFSVRTERAINQMSKAVLFSDYLGKGQYSMSFPEHDNRTELIQKVIDRIRTMDDDAFNRFIDYAVIQINHKNSLKDISVDEFIKGLYQIRKSQQNIRVYGDKNDGNYTYFAPNSYPTIWWFPGCFIIFFTIFFLDFLIIAIVYFATTHTPPTATVSGCCMLS